MLHFLWTNKWWWWRWWWWWYCLALTTKLLLHDHKREHFRRVVIMSVNNTTVGQRLKRLRWASLTGAVGLWRAASGQCAGQRRANWPQAITARIWHRQLTAAAADAAALFNLCSDYISVTAAVMKRATKSLQKSPRLGPANVIATQPAAEFRLSVLISPTDFSEGVGRGFTATPTTASLRMSETITTH